MNDPLQQEAFLPGVPASLVQAFYNAAPGNEIATGKFTSPESSAALVANAFGFFLNRPHDLPILPESLTMGWPAVSFTSWIVNADESIRRHAKAVLNRFALNLNG